jgi:UTP--glucose-1-phosphate uridylyltransferase
MGISHFAGDIMTQDIQIAVIPVAGLGTRLLPATKSQPKEMLPIGRKPVVQYVVEEMEANGIHQIVFITGKSKTSIENHFDFDHELVRSLRENGKEELLSELEYERMRLQFYFTRQRRPKGLGDAVLCAEHFTRDRPFVVALGDSVIGLHGSAQVVSRMIDTYRQNAPCAVIALQEVPLASVSRYGIVRAAGDGPVFPIADLIEKPSPDEAPSRLAITARYVFPPAIHPALQKTLPDRRGEVQLTDAIRLLLRENIPVMGVRLTPEEKRYDVGNFQNYFEAFLEFALTDPQLGPDLQMTLRERFREDR